MQTVVSLFEQSLQRDPNGPAIKFNAGESRVSLSRSEVDQRARAIAARLSTLAVPGARVLMLYPSGVEFLCAFYGVLYAGMVAVPVYPPDARPLSRRRFASLVDNCDPAVIAGTRDLLVGRLDAKSIGAWPQIAGLPKLATDEIALADAPLYKRPEIAGSTEAYIQYTSGSTGEPRGVMHLHGNVAEAIGLFQRACRLEAHDSCVLWLPLYHDMGLIHSLTAISHTGFVSLMTPTAFLREPLRWLHLVSQERVRVTGAPNFAYDLCVRKATPEDYATLDLSCLELVYNGAEPVRADTLERFSQAFARCGLKQGVLSPAYGLAEATLVVSVAPRGAGPRATAFDEAALAERRVEPARFGYKARTLVAVGETYPEAAVTIVDPETHRRCRANEVGEIWVKGPVVGRGYWRRPEDTARSFEARIEPDGAGPFLRTGDLGFMAGGQLHIAGRLKDLIIVRGRNYYPQDIEDLVDAAHPAIRRNCSVAASIESADGEVLAVFFETQPGRHNATLTEVIDAVQDQIAVNAGVPASVLVVVKAAAVPKTSSGKIRRRACVESFAESTLPVLAVRDLRPKAKQPPAPVAEGPNVERVAARLVQEITRALGHAVEPSDMVTRVGVDSVTAIEIMFALEKEFGLRISAEDFAQPISLTALAERIAGVGNHMGANAATESDSKMGRRATAHVDLSLMYFSTDTLPVAQRYDLLIRSARFADQHGFRALWLPERHFHEFGGAYPNPATAAAALAVMTDKIRLRAGSVVAPLHDPIRIAEEWSFVDNLSHGRVDLAFASGWSPDDFVLAPRNYSERREIAREAIERVRKLWRGGELVLVNGLGARSSVRVHPVPVQSELNVWRTCASEIDGFVEAGARGYNVLTALLFQELDSLAERITAYREARAAHGHDPDGGVVTLMLHAFVGPSRERVLAKVREPLRRYIASSIDLWRAAWPELAALEAEGRERLLDAAVERYASRHALFGTPQSCAELVGQVRAIGVREIACLVDFGVHPDDVIESLPHLDELRRLVATDQ